ncbi:MAG TPA: response regulator, partial [Vicinamibacterales bacterium]|nr:response regulator [Vicinamibacterales bacterium]
MTAEAKKSVPLRVLLVEDSEPDAELLLAELNNAGYHVVAHRVQTAEEMRAALTRDAWQVVLADYGLPSFDAPAALAITHELKPDLPFIIVSGTVGEDAAIAALKAGASDFVAKSRLARLVPAIERELRDADLRREQARERDALAEQLRQSQKLEGIGRLAGGIAHDFNNLLTAIIGYTEMVLEQIGPDKPISQDLMEIRKASDRAVALTRQLLAFSRKQTLRVAAMEPNAIITDMGNMLQRLIGVDIDIRFELAPGLPPILADRVQMEQVVMNLVMNARDAMPKGGVITIATTVVQADAVTAVVHEPVAPGAYVG